MDLIELVLLQAVAKGQPAPAGGLRPHQQPSGGFRIAHQQPKASAGQPAGMVIQGLFDPLRSKAKQKPDTAMSKKWSLENEVKQMQVLVADYEKLKGKADSRTTKDGGGEGGTHDAAQVVRLPWRLQCHFCLVHVCRMHLPDKIDHV